jgi:hypothetical protein
MANNRDEEDMKLSDLNRELFRVEGLPVRNIPLETAISNKMEAIEPNQFTIIRRIQRGDQLAQERDRAQRGEGCYMIKGGRYTGTRFGGVKSRGSKYVFI